ncbi:MAG: biotin/lipoyl-binding protein, partial [Methyloglobulus sp.]|nr:biotin/lipoyl-binding protein [Methyloglobulus sp.]
MSKGPVFVVLLVLLAQPFPAFAESPGLTPDSIVRQNEITSVEDKVPDQIETQTRTNAGQNLRAQIKARESTQISSERSGRISQLKIRDGERFTAGQVLVSFHCSLEEAQLS